MWTCYPPPHCTATATRPPHILPAPLPTPCRVSWPLTLVVPPSQLSHYQLVFKLLLTLKLTERQLSSVWHRIASGTR